MTALLWMAAAILFSFAAAFNPAVDRRIYNLIAAGFCALVALTLMGVLR